MPFERRRFSKRPIIDQDVLARADHIAVASRRNKWQPVTIEQIARVCYKITNPSQEYLDKLRAEYQGVVDAGLVTLDGELYTLTSQGARTVRAEDPHRLPPTTYKSELMHHRNAHNQGTYEALGRKEKR